MNKKIPYRYRLSQFLILTVLTGLTIFCTPAFAEEDDDDPDSVFAVELSAEGTADDASIEEAPDAGESSSQSSQKGKKPSGEDEESVFADGDGLIEDPSGNKVDEKISFEITDSWYAEEIAKEEAEWEAAHRGPVYGKLYPPAPLLEGINVFRQGDMRWGTHPYGYANGAGTIPATISSSGCGLLSLVNAVYYMTGNFIDPVPLSDWAVQNGFRLNGVGTVHAMYKAYADRFGKDLGFSFAGTAPSLSSIRSFLHNGGTAVISTSHHLMSIADYDADKGGFLLLDSAPSSWRGTYPTGYCYLTEAQIAEGIPIYGIFLFKPTNGDSSEQAALPFSAFDDPAQIFSQAFLEGKELPAEDLYMQELLYQYLLDQYRQDQHPGIEDAPLAGP